MLPHLVSTVFWLAVLGLAWGLARRALIWRNGRAASVNWSGLLQIPKRYFVDLHDVVAREPFVARAHVGVAGGALLALALVALNYGLGLYWHSLDAVLLLAGLLMLAGASAAAAAQRTRTPIQGPVEPFTLFPAAVCAGGVAGGRCGTDGYSTRTVAGWPDRVGVCRRCCRTRAGRGLGRPHETCGGGPVAPGPAPQARTFWRQAFRHGPEAPALDCRRHGRGQAGRFRLEQAAVV